MKAVDLDDPERLANLRWASVLSQWYDGDPTPMAAWLDDTAVPLLDDARHFLADLVRGSVKRPRGRRGRRPAGDDRTIVVEVFNERELQAGKLRVANPLERAIDTVAKRRKLSDHAVRGIVDRLGKDGITFEAWKRWGRPTWTS